MRVYIGRIALYAFSLVIVYLAGVYFGSFLYFLCIFFIVFPLLSILFSTIWWARIRYKQSFSTLSPVKGQMVRYKLTLKNSGFFPIVSLDVRFISVSPLLDLELPDFQTILRARDRVNREYTIKCPYRGIYSIGLKELVVHDLLHLISLNRPAAPITLSVYPRIIPIDRFSPLVASVDGRSTSSRFPPDSTLFYQLREYRDGDPIKHIYWKKYASTGRPYMKEYEKTLRADVRIYLDLRRMNNNPGLNFLEQADLSVETLVALVKYFLDRKMRTTVLAPGLEPFPFVGRDAADFKNFYLATPSISSDGAVSPVALIQMENRSEVLSSQTIIFITHNIDPQLFSLPGNSDRSAQHILYIMNTASYPRAEREKIKSSLDNMRWQRADIVEVKNADSLVGDLTGGIHVPI
jgi:uncharacterized protein (DUF58 family)